MSTPSETKTSGAAPMKGKPNFFLRAIMRAPIILYRLGLGRLLGKRFILLRHTGRRTGEERTALVEVTHRERGVYYVTSGWGEKSQWYQNVITNPRLSVTVGGRTFPVTGERVSVEEAERVLREYTKRYRFAARGLAPMFGSRDPAELARALPVVAFRRVKDEDAG